MRKQTNRGFFKTLAAQFAKFGVVGFLAFLIDYAVLMVLTQALGWDPVLSAAISFVISVVFNYLASMQYVFTRRDDLSRRKEFALFVVLSVIGLGINELVIWVGTAAFGAGALAVTATKVVATVIVALWNFWSRKKWLDASSY